MRLDRIVSFFLPFHSSMSRSHNSHHSRRSTNPSSSRPVERSTPSGKRNGHPDPFGPIRQDLAHVSSTSYPIATQDGHYLPSHSSAHPLKCSIVEGAFHGAFGAMQKELATCKYVGFVSRKHSFSYISPAECQQKKVLGKIFLVTCGPSGISCSQLWKHNYPSLKQYASSSITIGVEAEDGTQVLRISSSRREI